MTLTRGTRLGPYETLSGLGAGGMGEVYRAIPIFGLEKSDGTIALAIELVDGPALADVIGQSAIPITKAE